MVSEKMGEREGAVGSPAAAERVDHTSPNEPHHVRQGLPHRVGGRLTSFGLGCPYQDVHCLREEGSPPGVGPPRGRRRPCVRVPSGSLVVGRVCCPAVGGGSWRVVGVLV